MRTFITATLAASVMAFGGMGGFFNEMKKGHRGEGPRGFKGEGRPFKGDREERHFRGDREERHHGEDREDRPNRGDREERHFRGDREERHHGEDREERPFREERMAKKQARKEEHMAKKQAHRKERESNDELEMALHTDYMRYVATFNKVYDHSDEYKERMGYFRTNILKAKELHENPETLASFGVTQFSDWSDEEFQAIQGLRNVADEQVTTGFSVSMVRDEPNPASVDWRTDGHVSEVKDQGQCGSCWAFSSTGALESAYSIFKGEMPLVSEQQLVDCADGVWRNQGCSGGWYYWAYNYLDHSHALETESEYPYTAQDGTCSDESLGHVTVTGSVGYAEVTPGLDSIKAAIAKQPVNVAVAAGNSVFQGYTGGIITEADGCPTRIDHAILAVGYGEENGTEYYIVKNSWASTWGEDGYVRIQAIDGATGVCGINQNVAYPIVA